MTAAISRHSTLPIFAAQAVGLSAVIAVSAHHYDVPGPGEEGLGCDGFLAKPMDGAEVVRHVIEVLAASHKSAVAQSQSNPRGQS